VLVVSIFVNPMQFGAGEDYKDYPRKWERDIELISSVNADCIFAPDAEEMYPQGYQTSVKVGNLTKNLCGIARPAHFEGVATVVSKLFNCVMPTSAIFGKKDFQQLVVIKRMVRDLDFDLEIIGAPIVREPDGLALSSRNIYLNANERIAALCLSRSLFEVKKLFDAGERDAARLRDYAQSIICSEKHARIDYIKICDVETLEDVTCIEREAVMALAVYFGRARLIDNIVLSKTNDVS
ncbi:MAG: pantoate--beta-alanine ligase, partial [Pseudomonadota bacterium]